MVQRSLFYHFPMRNEAHLWRWDQQHAAWHLRTLSLSTRARLFATLWVVAHQAPLSMGFSRQEYWSASALPPPEDLPHSGIEPKSFSSPTLAGRFSTTVQLGKPHYLAENVKVMMKLNDNSFLLLFSRGLAWPGFDLKIWGPALPRWWIWSYSGHVSGPRREASCGVHTLYYYVRDSSGTK